MKADELWKKYCRGQWDAAGRDCEDVVTKTDFIAALNEYGEHVRAEAVSVCLSESTCEGIAQRCAAAIEKMELP
jgi:hypothetical protein